MCCMSLTLKRVCVPNVVDNGEVEIWLFSHLNLNFYQIVSASLCKYFSSCMIAISIKHNSKLHKRNMVGLMLIMHYNSAIKLENTFYCIWLDLSKF